MRDGRIGGRARRNRLGVLVAAVAGLAGTACVAGCDSTTTGAARVPAAGGVSTTSPATPTTSSGTVGACRADQLAVALRPLPGVATGRSYADIVLTDTSKSSCTLKGTVTLTVADAAHHAIAIPVGQDPSSATLVTLGPGASAAETLTYSSDGNPPPGQTDCTPVAAYYAITPPGTSKATVVAVPARGACPHDGIQLSNLVAGDYSPPM